MNENYDSLQGWREANFTSYAGQGEYDETVEYLEAFSKLPKEEQEKELSDRVILHHRRTFMCILRSVHPFLWRWHAASWG